MAQRPAGKSEPQKKPVPKKPAAVKKAAGTAVPAKRPAAKKSPSATAKPALKKAPAKKAARTKSTDAQTLTARESKFIDEFLVDLNGTQAAIRAGYSSKTARQIASENLSKPHIQVAIAEARKQQQERTQITADAMLQQAWLIATADARELIETKVACCRHCWGENFRYQRTISEMNHAREAWRAEGKAPEDFDEEGGIGFNPHRPPHPDCTACVGDGYAREVIKDTRYLSPAAAQLYAGVKRTKDGLQVLTHSKEAFAEKIWKYLGMYERDNQQKSDPLAALLHRISKENGNGFSPIADDPERTGPRAGSTLQVKQDPTDEEG
ncbi:terminase small subunit [Delftia tsuruhatensis]|uniref:terminase small subunit n=1 Tax=Delftia tsuruhatensis TaxID=180282 RepID=UPI00244C13DB|nr:terminase small subunit [Delftia tsuruhatensis]MDH0852107.1 terminase small subunit [Delftia tsuruhatensis]